MDTRLSERARRRAERSLAGGVDSPVRSFDSVDSQPVFADRGEGPYVWDLDGNRYVDLLMSWGALILGHAHPGVAAALREGARLGTGYGLSTRPEAELAEGIK
jgi:glutamate-1-semialdehyde 2,1-aminomutase